MMTFLKTVLIVLLVYYGLKFLTKLLAPYFMRYITKKANKKFEQFFNQAAQGNGAPQPEGKTTIDKKPKTTKNSSKTVGEYVDFEEID